MELEVWDFFLVFLGCPGERIRTEHFASSSYLSAEVVAGGTMSFSLSSSEGIGEWGLSEAWVLVVVVVGCF